MACEIGDYFADALIKIRDMMVRWPVSPEQLLNDRFYTYNKLLEKLYCFGFVDHLLKDVRKFEKIFSSYKYDATQNEGNLLNELYKAGFYCVKKWYDDKPQYVWVNPQGYVVRVKYNKNAEPKPTWEFTVGISFENPLIWRDDEAVRINRAVAPNAKAPFYRQLTKYDDFVSYKFNEIFKIVIDGELTMILPAGTLHYWLNDYSQKSQVMKKAHKPLFGIGNFARVEEYCSDLKS